MARELLPHERCLQQDLNIDFEALPKYLKAKVIVLQNAIQKHGPLPALVAESTDLEQEICDWYDDEESEHDEPDAPDAPDAPQDHNQNVLETLYGAGKRQVSAGDLKKAGYQGNPGTYGKAHGAYGLKKSIISSTYKLYKQ
jgi:hypothetical protein